MLSLCLNSHSYGWKLLLMEPLTSLRQCVVSMMLVGQAKAGDGVCLHLAVLDGLLQQAFPLGGPRTGGACSGVGQAEAILGNGPLRPARLQHWTALACSRSSLAGGWLYLSLSITRSHQCKSTKATLTSSCRHWDTGGKQSRH